MISIVSRIWLARELKDSSMDQNSKSKCHLVKKLKFKITQINIQYDNIEVRYNQNYYSYS